MNEDFGVGPRRSTSTGANGVTSAPPLQQATINIDKYKPTAKLTPSPAKQTAGAPDITDSSLWQSGANPLLQQAAGGSTDDGPAGAGGSNGGGASDASPSGSADGNGKGPW